MKNVLGDFGTQGSISDYQLRTPCHGGWKYPVKLRVLVRLVPKIQNIHFNKTSALNRIY